MADANPLLAVRELHKHFGADGERQVAVLNGISFELQVGESLAITGPSGSGKSTLLHIVGALDDPTSGTAVVEGIDLQHLSELESARFRNEAVGFVFQDHYLLPQYTALENVLLPCLAHGAPTPRQVARAHELLRRVDLTARAHHRPGELSGGESQRVAVARSLINAPRLLLCDEPTGNLDSDSAELVVTLIMNLQRQEGSGLIVVTHSPDLARRCNCQMELRNGLVCLPP